MPGNARQQSEDVVFRAFDPQAEVHRWRRNLPHWFQPGVAAFITFRTADSMPSEVIERWLREQQDWLRRHDFDVDAATDLRQLARLPIALQREFRRLRDRLWHRSLDDCHGKCLLRRPDLAEIVGSALLHFDQVRYDLDSLVVVANHVHVLVQFRAGSALREQTESWLRYTARKINAKLGRRGPFWRSEPFDNLVRSPEQFVYLRRYIAENPAKANLAEGEYLYWTRSDR